MDFNTKMAEVLAQSNTDTETTEGKLIFLEALNLAATDRDFTRLHAQANRFDLMIVFLDRATQVGAQIGSDSSAYLSDSLRPIPQFP